MSKQIFEESLLLRLSVSYHYAHAIQYGQKVSGIQLINPREGIVEIQETLIDITQNILVKFSYRGIDALLNREKIKFNNETTVRDNLSLELDVYSGVVVIKYTIPRSAPNPSASLQWIKVNTDPYIYQENIGYSEEVKDVLSAGNTIAGIPGQIRMVNNYKPADDFGYILESPQRIAVIFLKGFGCVENLQKGIVKLKTSSFDTNGYIVQLFPEAILNITQLLDRTNSPLLENDVQLKKVKEEKRDREQSKEEAFGLTKETDLELHSLNLSELINESTSLAGDHHEQT